MIAVKTSPRLKNNCNILLASLAGTDFLTGMLGQPLVVAEQIYRLTGNSMDSYSACLLKYITLMTALPSVIASIQHLALLSIERYLAIKYPFKYVQMVTERRLITSAITTWSLVALLTVLTSVYAVDNAFVSFFRNFLILSNISVLIFCHISVYREARTQTLKIVTQQISTEASQIFLKEKKALNTTTIVIGVAMFSFVPVTSFGLVVKPLLRSPGAMQFVMRYACITLLLCNSVCNPLIYCVRSTEFRKSFKRILFRRSRVQAD